MKIKLIF